MANFLEHLLRAGEKREVRRANALIGQINALEFVYEEMTDEELAAQTPEFKERIKSGESLDVLIPEAFAVVREVARRVLGKRHYDVQLEGGIALHYGQVAEMKTGEGKAVTVSTPIPTPTGAKLAGDIRVGDTVYAGNGDLTVIAGVFPQGKQDVYALVLDDLRTVRCNLQHRWDIAPRMSSTLYETVETEDILRKLKSGQQVFIPRNGCTLNDDMALATHPTETVKVTEDSLLSVTDFEGTTRVVNDSSNYMYLGSSTYVRDNRSPLKPLQRSGVIVAYRDKRNHAVKHFFVNLDKAPAAKLEAGNLAEVLSATAAPSFGDPANTVAPAKYQAENFIQMTSKPVGATGLRIGYTLTRGNAETIAWYARALGYSATVKDVEGLGFFPYTVQIDTAPTGNVEVTAVLELGVQEEQVCFTVTHPSHLFLAGDHVVTHNTLTAVAPMYLNALTGKGAHLVTTNDYLAREQEQQMGLIYSFLGLTHGALQESMSPEERRDIYSRDIVYGTNNQFGFDYLRDNLALTPEERVQRELNFVIIDELDSILLDEATTPLIISAPAQNVEEAEKWFTNAAALMPLLKRDEHYTVDEKKKVVDFTDEGLDMIIDYFGTTDKILFGSHSEILTFLRSALQAETLYHNRKEYIIQGGEIMIVDEHTGRAMEGRRYSDGLHQAIEAKERRNGHLEVKIQPENPTSATITLQNFFRLYDKMSGMTGTAASEAAELADTYGLAVRTIPPNKPKQRIDEQDELYLTEQDKMDAVVAEILDIRQRALDEVEDGEEPLIQPILIGTTSVAASEKLSRKLAKAGIVHNVLNAKHIEKEAHIIAQAGKLGAVTVSTNMAGRGTDILLGGNAEMMVAEQLAIMGLSIEHTPAAYEGQYKVLLPQMEEKISAEAEKVRAAGGLYVMGTARHDSRRIDNQLIGRSGRQGDPGCSKFFLSLEDELFRFHASRYTLILARLFEAYGSPIKGKQLTKAIERAQGAVDGMHRSSRKQTLEYDDVLNGQRKKLYSDRTEILLGDDDMAADLAVNFIGSSVRTTVEGWITENGEHLDDWDLPTLWKHLREELEWVPSITPKDLLSEYPTSTELTQSVLVDELVAAAKVHWDSLLEANSVWRTQARSIILGAIDQEWVGHLADLGYLKEGIGLRAYAQKDPKIEYRLESADMFNQMTSTLIPKRVAQELLKPRI